MNPLAFFSSPGFKLAIAIGVILSAYSWHSAQVSIAVNKATMQIEAQVSRENLNLRERSAAAKIELEQEFNNIQKDKNAKIKILNDRVASLTRSLQERPNRSESGGVPGNPGVEENEAGATGVQLYRQDGEFLTGEASRAELIKVELFGCYRSYDDIKKKLDDFKRN